MLTSLSALRNHISAEKLSKIEKNRGVGKVPIFITFSRFLFTFCNGVAHTLMITTEYFGNCFGQTNFR